MNDKFETDKQDPGQDPCIETGRCILRNLSVEDFLAFGVNQIVYIKPITMMGQTAYALNSADGAPLAVLEDLQAAHIAARQNDLEPVTLQ